MLYSAETHGRANQDWVQQSNKAFKKQHQTGKICVRNKPTLISRFSTPGKYVGQPEKYCAMNLNKTIILSNLDITFQK